MAYARRFTNPPHSCAGEGIYIIAPGFGLVSPDWRIDLPRFERLRRVPVDPKLRIFTTSLKQAARALADRLDPDTIVVLLGSLAPDKYLPVLCPVFENRLRAPEAFIGTGDMRRGALLLRAVATGQELDYLACSELMSSGAGGKRRTHCATEPA
jgi:hypothetical protein